MFYLSCNVPHVVLRVESTLVNAVREHVFYCQSNELVRLTTWEILVITKIKVFD